MGRLARYGQRDGLVHETIYRPEQGDLRTWGNTGNSPLRSNLNQVAKKGESSTEARKAPGIDGITKNAEIWRCSSKSKNILNMEVRQFKEGESKDIILIL